MGEEELAASELRLAVAMNGGVSLAVWIGGVTHELNRFLQGRDGWSATSALGRRADVLAGTSAGGLNAAFLALAERFGADLGGLRDLWLDVAGLEPLPGDDLHTPLLRSPRKGAPSLLDGGYFFDELKKAFLAVLPGSVPAPATPTPTEDMPGGPVDLRLTTTVLEGYSTPVTLLAGQAGEKSHRANFHFVDTEAPGRTGTALTWEDGDERDRLAAQLARAARSTASFPFAFEPSKGTGGDDAALEPDRTPADRSELMGRSLVDGGVLNNLPIDEAIEAVFAMPASEPVARWLVAVVPDPADPVVDPPAGADPMSVFGALLASGVSIPRNQTVGALVETVERNNARVDQLRAARNALLAVPIPTASTAAAAAAEGNDDTDSPSDDSSTARRDHYVAFLLDMHDRSQVAATGRREQIHALAPTTDLDDQAAALLVAIATTWPESTPKPNAIEDISGAEPLAAATSLLRSVDLLHRAIAPDGVDQKVCLGLLTPQVPAPLDPLGRTGARQKVAGDDLGHFGAFLKRSWRANDWMWGRLDASSFLFDLLAHLGHPMSMGSQLAVQAAIVKDEAPVICAAVLADRHAGALSVHGEALLAAVGISDTARGSGAPAPAVSWDAMAEHVLRAAAPAGFAEDEAHIEAARRFLGACCIGEETLRQELWTSLVARVGIRAVATSLTVLQDAGLPFQSFWAKATIPIRAIALVADRYAQALRPRWATTHDTAWVARLATVALAGLAALNLIGIDFGSLAPLLWLGLAGALLSFLAIAPVTTAIVVAGVALTGAAMRMPHDWATRLPGPLSSLPINGWAGAAIIVGSLGAITLPVVDSADRKLRHLITSARAKLRRLEPAPVQRPTNSSVSRPEGGPYPWPSGSGVEA